MASRTLTQFVERNPVVLFLYLVFALACHEMNNYSYFM